MEKIKVKDIDVSIVKETDQETALIVRSAEVLVIKDQTTYESAGEFRSKIREGIKNLETLRKTITGPLDQAKSAVMNLFRPRRGVSQILGMLDHFNSMKPAGVSKMQESIEKYKKTVKNKSYIVIFSDFLIDIAEIKKALMRLSAGEHEVVAVQVLDKSEINLKLEGDLRLHDSETRSVMRTFMTERMKQEYKDKLKMHIMAVEKECDLLGIRFKLVSTNVPLFDVFYDLFVFKK